MKNKSENQPKVSIIIPVYNVEKYLRQCLDSVINQSMQDIEIICVEDCSTDGSPEILREYAAKDSRITCVFHEKNSGLTITRKDGVKFATGEYILFLDSDDYLTGTACQALYKQIKKKDVDIFQFGSIVVAAGGTDEANRRGAQEYLVPCCDHIVSKRAGDITNACYRDHRFNFTIWNKMYRADVVRTAFAYTCDEGFNLAEDAYLFFLITFFSKSFAGTSENYHFYNFGAGMTGGIKPVTDRSFCEKTRRGLIVHELQQFAEKMAPDHYLDDCLAHLNTIFIEDTLYTLVEHCGNVDASTVLKNLLSCFDAATVIAKFQTVLRYISKKKQREFFNNLSAEEVFPVFTGDVKTIATFYYRMNNGGIERVLAKLLSIWKKSGYRVILFTDDVPSPSDYEYPAEVTRIILPPITDGNEESIRTRSEYLHDMLEKYNVDAMVYHAWQSPYLLADMMTVKAMGLGFITHVHGYLHMTLSNFYAQAAHQSILFATLVKFFDGIVVLSECDKQWLELVHKNVYKTVNPLPFDLNEVAPIDLQANRDLLWVGRISPEKNFMDALVILRKVLDFGCQTKLHVVGEAYTQEYHREVLARIQELELQDEVILHGFQTEVAPFYQKAGIHLVTSEAEGFCMVIAESKAYGIPTITYDLPNLDFVQDGRGLRIVPQKSTQGAALVIVDLLKSDKERERLGQEARRSIEDFYAVDISSLWNQIFSGIIKKGRKITNAQASPIQTAIEMLMDSMDRGIEARQRDLEWWINEAHSRKSTDLSVDYKEMVLEMYQNGQLGFRYIIQYAVAWLKFKFKIGRKS